MAKNSMMGRYASGKAKDFAVKAAFDEDGNPTETFEKVVFRTLDVQRPLVLKNIQRIRENHPGETPEQLAQRLSDQYVNTVTGAGAAVGGTAIIPGIGTVAALGLSAAATVGFLEATALYAQSLAELHGITTQDPERSKALVMAVMLGEDAKELLGELAQRSGGRGPGDPSTGLTAMLGTGSGAGMGAMVVEQLKKRFIKRLLVRQGAGFVGRAVPFGIGAVIGGVGNRAMAKAVVQNARELFGPLPTVLPEEIASVPVEGGRSRGGLLSGVLKALPGGRKDEDAPSA
ncbi:hypothetical protein [Micrococcus sp.]|uniref:hypothetical protein n=1 Tax=Micrococcus sp. TaxID=1271 RepID=UPI002A90D5EE|nr:hypothetical protein [Micrococcus sp.]MDY6056026.1 hypothetical protein [Micrococcus sp.]